MTSDFSAAPAVAEVPLQSRSASLRRELGLRDLVLAQLLYIIIPEFFGAAAKAGPYHAALWILAIVFFFVPEALVVARLNRLMPLEGGLYEWARIAFGDRVGFLVAWNLWLYSVVYMALSGFITTSFVAYAIGPSGLWIGQSKWLILLVSLATIMAMILLARAGFAVAKWVTNIGGIVTLITLGLLMAAAAFSKGSAVNVTAARIAAPPLTLFTLGVFSQMTFGALCGFEYIAIFAGECRNPERNLARSVLITAPVIALLYIFGTSAILHFSTPESVDVVAAIPQALSHTFHSFAFAGAIVPVSILLLLANYLATFNINFSGCSRLPMVAGWDCLLPAWFSRLHPRHKTPVNSIYFAGAVSLVASAVALVGVGRQEGFEQLLVWAFAFYATAYLALFAIPLLARKALNIRPALWIRAAAVSGFLVTLLYIVLSIYPIIDVQNAKAFSIKTAAVLIGLNLIGVALFLWRANSRGGVAPGRT